MAPIELKDESFPVLLRRNGQEHYVQLDLLETRLMFEDLEGKHSLRKENGKVYATREFLSEVASHLQEKGITEATPTMAYQLWTRMNEVYDAIKKNMLEESKSGGSSE